MAVKLRPAESLSEIEPVEISQQIQLTDAGVRTGLELGQPQTANARGLEDARPGDRCLDPRESKLPTEPRPQVPTMSAGRPPPRALLRRATRQQDMHRRSHGLGIVGDVEDRRLPTPRLPPADHRVGTTESSSESSLGQPGLAAGDREPSSKDGLGHAVIRDRGVGARRCRPRFFRRHLWRFARGPMRGRSPRGVPRPRGSARQPSGSPRRATRWPSDAERARR